MSTSRWWKWSWHPCVLSLAAVVALASCGNQESWEELDVDCAGKCDGMDSIRSLLRDPRDLRLDDLIELGAPYATDALNDTLAFSDYGSLAIGETEIYDRGEIGSLATGLAARFGERELTTEVNTIRRAHLDSSSDSVFAESAFEIKANFHDGWNYAAEGLEDTTVRLGFDADAALETRVIAAFGGNTNAILTAPLRAMRESPRGFVLPRGLDDIREMKPGELVAMNAHGQLGINLGVGVPILIAEPLSAVSYSFVLSAGLKTRLEGDLDIQLIRLADGEVVVDVGIQRAQVRSARLAVEDRWGVQGLLELEVEVAGINVDLGRLVERALQDQLNRRLNLLSARLEQSSLKLRMSVARLRFDLDSGDPAILEPAIAQALRGDVRLAQALANRGEPGVVVEFDLLRSGASATSYAGIDIFGMSFHKKTIESEGSIVVQTPGGARTILFDSLHRSSGFFVSRHGYTRVALSGLVFDPSVSRDPSGEVNLFVQVSESDKAMERDKLIDHLDGVIVGIAGSTALASIERPGNQLERLVETECAGTEVYDDCPIDMLTDSRAVQLRADGAAALQSATGHLGSDVRDLVLQAGELRLLAQSVYEQKAQFTGPGTSIVLDYRLDDSALDVLLASGSGAVLASAMERYLTAVEIDRQDDPATIAGDRAEIAAQASARLRALGTKLDDYARRYRKLESIEGAAIERLGAIGARAIEIRFQVDSSNRPIYEEAAARSIVQVQAQLVAEMFEELLVDASGFGPHAEQVVAYGLLGMVPAERVDLRLALNFNLDDGWLFWREPYREAGYPETRDLYARGSMVKPIDGGLFDVDALIEIRE